MNKVLLITFLVYLSLSPFYFFKSGLPQPADYIMAVGIVVFISQVKKDFFIKIAPVKIFALFVIIVTVVSLVNQVFIYKNGIQGNTLLPILYYSFNFSVFCVIIFLNTKFKKEYFFNTVSLVLVLMIVVQFILSLLDIQHQDSSWVERGMRSIVFFNNPNQLGYFALLIYTLFIIVPSRYQKKKIVVIIMALMTLNIAVLSLSRSAIVGLLLLNVFLIIRELLKYKTKTIIYFSMFVLGSVLVLFKTDYVVNKVEIIKERVEKKNYSFDTELKIRGYKRIMNNPKYVLFGAGEGAVSRFKSLNNKEIHSGFVTILFSYGIFGLLVFVYLLYEIIKYNVIYNLLILAPVFLHNLAHQGFRNTLFWVLLAFIFLNQNNVNNHKIRTIMN